MHCTPEPVPFSNPKTGLMYTARFNGRTAARFSGGLALTDNGSTQRQLNGNGFEEMDFISHAILA